MERIRRIPVDSLCPQCGQGMKIVKKRTGKPVLGLHSCFEYRQCNACGYNFPPVNVLFFGVREK